MKTITKQELFQTYAPSFNFEYDADQLLQEALKRGSVTKIEDKEDTYMVNEDY